jgi:hypothetical protein
MEGGVRRYHLTNGEDGLLLYATELVMQLMVDYRMAEVEVEMVAHYTWVEELLQTPELEIELVPGSDKVQLHRLGLIFIIHPMIAPGLIGVLGLPIKFIIE